MHDQAVMLCSLCKCMYAATTAHRPQSAADFRLLMKGVQSSDPCILPMSSDQDQLR